MLYKEAIPFLTTGRQGARSRGQAENIEEFQEKANAPVSLRDREELIKGNEVIYRNTPDNSPSGIMSRYSGILAGSVTGAGLGTFAGSRAFYGDKRSNLKWLFDTTKNLALVDSNNLKQIHDTYTPIIKDVINKNTTLEQGADKAKSSFIKSNILTRLNDPDFHTQQHYKSMAKGALKGMGKGVAISSIPTALWLTKNYLDSKYHHKNMENIHKKYGVKFNPEYSLNTFY